MCNSIECTLLRGLVVGTCNAVGLQPDQDHPKRHMSLSSHNTFKRLETELLWQPEQNKLGEHYHVEADVVQTQEHAHRLNLTIPLT